MWVSTFHSMCVRILRAQAKHLGIRSSFSIYDADDSRRLLTLVTRELSLDPKRYPARSLSVQISNLKNELIGRGSSPSGPAPRTERALAEVYQRYQQRLTESSAMDFDDLIMTTVRLLQNQPRRGRALPPAVPARAGRRVPGHQPRPVRAGRRAVQADAGARSPAGGRAVRGR